MNVIYPSVCSTDDSFVSRFLCSIHVYMYTMRMSSVEAPERSMIHSLVYESAYGLCTGRHITGLTSRGDRRGLTTSTHSLLGLT